MIREQSLLMLSIEGVAATSRTSCSRFHPGIFYPAVFVFHLLLCSRLRVSFPPLWKNKIVLRSSLGRIYVFVAFCSPSAVRLRSPFPSDERRVWEAVLSAAAVGSARSSFETGQELRETNLKRAMKHARTYVRRGLD